MGIGEEGRNSLNVGGINVSDSEPVIAFQTGSEKFSVSVFSLLGNMCCYIIVVPLCSGSYGFTF